MQMTKALTNLSPPQTNLATVAQQRTKPKQIRRLPFQRLRLDHGEACQGNPHREACQCNHDREACQINRHLKHLIPDYVVQRRDANHVQMKNYCARVLKEAGRILKNDFA